MSREIKFRAWDNLRKQMCNVICLNCHRDDEHILQRQTPIPCTSNECYNIPASDIDIMQYTGLKDNAGVEIYEGDIIVQVFEDDLGGSPEQSNLEYDHFEGVVMYEGCGFGIDTKGDGVMEVGIYEEAYELEVIGNVHENGDLLKENQND